VLTRIETMRYVGRFSLGFSAAVLLLGRYYANPGLYSISLGIAIIGALCLMESRRPEVLGRIVHQARASRPVRRPSGSFD
jgi:hypothetical protein